MILSKLWYLIAIMPAILVFFTVNLNIAPNVLYPLGKLLLFILILIKASKIKVRLILPKEVLRGLTNGLLLSIIPFVFILLGGLNYLDVSILMAKLDSLNLKENFVIFALVLSFFNSAFEELFFRHLILEKLDLDNIIKSSLLNGFIFSLHHLVVLAHYFSIEIALVFSLCTLIAGFIWSYLRLSGYTLYELWLSHSICDIVVILTAGSILLK